MKVKICGIRTKSAALAATKAGADFLGFNFVPSSKRKVTVGQAKSIIAALPKKRPQLVGVFQNQKLSEVKNILSQVPLDIAQLHGNESPAFALALKKPVIKAFGVDSKTSAQKLSRQMSKYKVKYFMLDRKNRGKGPLVSLDLVKRLASQFPIILAGGINPKNVKSSIVKAGRVICVDVAGGIEVNGKQDANKIRAFIQYAKKRHRL